MRRPLSIACLALAWVCLNGALSDCVQVFAWARMFAGYAECDRVGAALRETFDPAKPCAVCVAVAKAKAAEQRQAPAQAERSADKLLLALPSSRAAVFAGRGEQWPASGSRVALTRAEPVSLRPPRRS